MRILVTGSAGLVGSGLIPALSSLAEVRGFDHRAAGADYGEMLHPQEVEAAVDGVDGVVHLAAVSRVIWGEQDPDLCRQTNVGALRTILKAASASARRPWLIFASSREVYGQQDTFPVHEDAELRPCNVYGFTKVDGEALVAKAAAEGLRACTVRLSNVYGSTKDHPDRVIPAFARGAARGAALRVDGLAHTFDPTHIADVSRGLEALIRLLADGGRPPPPIHFVGGQPVTLGEVAALAVRLAGAGSFHEAPPRNYDVALFYGTRQRAKAILGWEPQVDLATGLHGLMQAYRDADA